MKKDEVFCELVGLPGRRGKTDACLIKEASAEHIRRIIESGRACTCAGDNGAVNIWRTDGGVLRAEAMRRMMSVERVVLLNYHSAAEWLAEWLERIG